MARKSMNTTIDSDLQEKFKLLATAKGLNMNDLLEKVMQEEINKNKDILNKYLQSLMEE